MAQPSLSSGAQLLTGSQPNGADPGRHHLCTDMPVVYDAKSMKPGVAGPNLNRPFVVALMRAPTRLPAAPGPPRSRSRCPRRPTSRSRPARTLAPAPNRVVAPKTGAALSDGKMLPGQVWQSPSDLRLYHCRARIEGQEDQKAATVAWAMVAAFFSDLGVTNQRIIGGGAALHRPTDVAAP
jgi:hypothetical protein